MLLHDRVERNNVCKSICIYYSDENSGLAAVRMCKVTLADCNFLHRKRGAVTRLANKHASRLQQWEPSSSVCDDAHCDLSLHRSHNTRTSLTISMLLE